MLLGHRTCIGIDLVVHRDDLNKLVYTSMCIKESMRLYPPVPNYARQLSQDYTFDGYKLQKGVDSGIASLLCSGVYTFSIPRETHFA